MWLEGSVTAVGCALSGPEVFLNDMNNCVEV